MTTTTADEAVVCPQGHQLSRSQVIIRDGMWVCPACAEQQRWAPAANRRSPWSRRLLRAPLFVLAGAFLVLAISSILDIASATAYVNNHLPGATSTLISEIISVVAELMLAAGFGWIGLLVSRTE